MEAGSRGSKNEATESLPTAGASKHTGVQHFINVRVKPY